MDFEVVHADTYIFGNVATGFPTPTKLLGGYWDSGDDKAKDCIPSLL